MYVSHNDVDQNQVCSIIADCRKLTQAGNYSHGYIGAKGNKREDIKKDACDKLNINSMHALEIRPGKISILYTHSDNWNAVSQLHFLAL